MSRRVVERKTLCGARQPVILSVRRVRAVWRCCSTPLCGHAYCGTQAFRNHIRGQKCHQSPVRNVRLERHSALPRGGFLFYDHVLRFGDGEISSSPLAKKIVSTDHLIHFRRSPPRFVLSALVVPQLSPSCFEVHLRCQIQSHIQSPSRYGQETKLCR